MSTSQLNLANSAHGSQTDDQPTHRRFFIGPMPQKVLSQTEAKVKKKKKRAWLSRSSNESDDEHDTLSVIIQDHAFQFFLREGGDEADWGEHQEHRIREEMHRRWGNSEWGHMWRRRNSEDKARANSWVGGSFEIGNFLGVSIMDDEVSRYSASIRRPGSSIRPPSSRRPSTSMVARPGTAGSHGTSQAAETFVTAPSKLNPSAALDVTRPQSSSRPNKSNSLLEPENGLDAGSQPASTSSTTALLAHAPDRPKFPVTARSEVLRRPILRSSTSEAVQDITGMHITLPEDRPPLITRQSKTVRYVDSPTTEDPPAPPSEVLARQGEAVEATSAGATDDTAPHEDSFVWGDVVMRDRMLVRVAYTKSEGLGAAFDEKQNSMTSNVRYEEWQEMMVVWRKDRIEIYEDYSLPGKEWMVGHKHLAFIIPLKTKTKLSLYSFVDLTFCLTCPPTPVHSSESKARAIFHRSKEGTNIFVFKVKSRTRALDWTWQLWRELGGEFPPYIEVRCPAMESRVKIDIPASVSLETEEGLAMFTRENIIGLVRNALKNFKDWEFIIEREVEKGKHIELAWRMDTKLDWIWLDDDVNGNKREFAVLCGLPLKQSGKSAHLEVRLGEHLPANVHLRDGRKLLEPGTIEGYLDRIRPNSQTKDSVYLASHDGYIFSMSPSHANPPTPPGLHPVMDEDLTLRQTEVRRGTQHIMHATGVCDVRSILTVRRAFHLLPAGVHSTEDVRGPKKAHEDDDEWLGTWSVEKTDSDDEDEGGDQGLAKTDDKSKLRMHRSFEFLLKSGHVIRFEAHSRRVALEWIERLHDLIVYWKHRHRVDAREEMDLALVGSNRPRLTPHLYAHCSDHDIPPEVPADMGGSLPALGSLYNWCVLDGCKAVYKSGKLFTRSGLHGGYKLVQMFLTSGHLIQYHITPKSSLHHRRSKKINLLDAYITSGYFAALQLPEGQYNASATSIPRRYQDGLEADDPEEDTLFMIWYRPQAPVIEGPAAVTPPVKAKGKSDNPQGQGGVPSLSAKRKLVVFRTRSKLERDAWCWAINAEIEKLVRSASQREERLREFGGLVGL